MANVSWWSATWVDPGETGLVPGASHHWWMTGFGFGDVIGATPQPLNSDQGNQNLAISDIRVDTTPNPHGGRTFRFTITNVGPVRAIAYNVNFSFVSQ